MSLCSTYRIGGLCIVTTATTLFTVTLPAQTASRRGNLELRKGRARAPRENPRGAAVLQQQ